MRNQIVIGISMITATVVLIFAGSARAEPAKVGDTFSGDAFMCDQESEVRTLYDAAQDKTGNALTMAYLKLNAARNEKGEPVCVYGTGRNITVTKVEHLGVAYGNTGVKFDTWLVDIKAKEVTGSMFYGELIKETAPSAPKS